MGCDLKLLVKVVHQELRLMRPLGYLQSLYYCCAVVVRRCVACITSMLRRIAQSIGSTVVADEIGNNPFGPRLRFLGVM